MIADNKDKIICKGFVYDCELGFHPHESRIHQKIKVDLTAFVSRIPADHGDKINEIRLDYYKANKLLAEHLKSRQFNLVETVADEIATLILDQFRVEAILVSVTKFPMDMPNIESIAFECFRSRDDLKK